MKPSAGVLLALLCCCVAHPLDPVQTEHAERPEQPGQLRHAEQSEPPGKPQFVLDPVCKNLPNGAGDHITTAIQDAIELAANAVKVLTHNADDKHVQDMCKYVLGGDDLANKLQQVKTTFENVAAFDSTPSSLTPIDPAWRARESNKDVAFFCDSSRWTDTSDKELMANAAWGGRQSKHRSVFEKKQTHCFVSKKVVDANKKSPSPITFTKASTCRSDITDHNSMTVDKKANPKNYNKDDRKYYAATKDANNIDVCTWYLELKEKHKWRRIDADLVKFVLMPESLKKMSTIPFQRPIDGVAEVLSKTMLHEVRVLGQMLAHAPEQNISDPPQLTHTNQGGVLHDFKDEARDLKIPGVNNCYGWHCVTNLHRAENSGKLNALAANVDDEC